MPIRHGLNRIRVFQGEGGGQKVKVILKQGIFFVKLKVLVLTSSCAVLNS